MADYAKQPRRKYCQFCKDDVEYIDYKDTQMLQQVRYRSWQDQAPSRDRCLHPAPGATSRKLLSAPASWLSCPMPFPLSAAVAIAATARRREENHESYSSEGTPGQRRRG